MKNINWKLVFDKVGTVIVDRRFWVSLFTTVILVFGTPELLGNVDSLSDQALEVTQLIVQVLGMILPLLNLVNSWTKRAPSGLGFKEVQTESDILAEAVIKAIKDQ